MASVSCQYATFFGGSAVRLICANLKTGVIHNPILFLIAQYEALGDHYMTVSVNRGGSRFLNPSLFDDEKNSPFSKTEQPADKAVELETISYQ